MEPLSLTITGMSCGHCVASVREALATVPAVEVQDVRLGRATVQTVDRAPATTAALVAAVQDAGYGVVLEPEAPPASSSGAPSGACCGDDAVTPLPLATARSA